MDNKEHSLGINGPDVECRQHCLSGPRRRDDNGPLVSLCPSQIQGEECVLLHDVGLDDRVSVEYFGE